jgi:hypothetical protein
MSELGEEDGREFHDGCGLFLILVEKIKSPTIGGLSDLRDDYISGL